MARDSDDDEADKACELCGDEYPADSLTVCETCGWTMCESCEYEGGMCRECWIEEHGDDDFGDDDE